MSAHCATGPGARRVAGVRMVHAEQDACDAWQASSRALPQQKWRGWEVVDAAATSSIRPNPGRSQGTAQ
jgi:hypothetical protein